MDQLVEIIKVLGTPSREEIHAMNPNYVEFQFPQIKAHPWTRVFNKRMPADGVDLVSHGAWGFGASRGFIGPMISRVKWALPSIREELSPMK